MNDAWRDEWRVLERDVERVLEETDAKDAWKKLAYTEKEKEEWVAGTSDKHKRPYYDFLIDLAKKHRETYRPERKESEYRKEILEKAKIWKAEWDIVWPPTAEAELTPEEDSWTDDFQLMMDGWKALVDRNHGAWRDSMQAFAKSPRKRKLGHDEGTRLWVDWSDQLDALLKLEQVHWMKAENRCKAHKVFEAMVKVLVTPMGSL
ncbi:hypothetical protein K491DRAFT_679849 [Lophiostoma macrostomum CBS 122681]|uniref:Uncharacterized protein n=1 Tax=Lophiostoma macrostomum CBS 122681 TaxID=1314788 RepID=A0A6A6T511_9PLEO|nr:hypothetical protein K491DRAFT_679849 [Lophiostoma macrostomum CBS 122681]